MDRGLLARGTCVKRAFIGVVLGFLLLRSTSYGDTESMCLCGAIPQWPLTKPSACSQSQNCFRYECIDGYVRKAGTSNRICCLNNKWTSPTLQCIEDPLSRKTTPKSKASSQTTALPQSSSPVTPSTENIFSFSTPQLTPEASSQTTALPQSSSQRPSTTSTSSRAPASSTTTTTTTTTTLPGPRRQDRTTSPSSHLSNSTSSSQQGAEAVPTNVIVPVVIVLTLLALGGAVFWFYRRKSRNAQLGNSSDSPDERIPMRQSSGPT